MEKINSFSKTQLRIEEDFNYMTEFVNIVQEIEIPSVVEFFQPLKEAYTIYGISIKKIIASGDTAEVLKADERRDYVVTGMFTYVTAMEMHYEESIADAARRVKIVMKVFKNPSYRSYSEESGIIINLLEELRKDEVMRYAQQINLEGWMEALQEAQRNFENIMSGRDIGDIDRNVEYIAKQERANTHEQYLKFVEMYNATLLVTKDGDLIYSAKRVNEAVERYKNLIAQRKGRAAAEKKKKEEEKNKEQNI